MSPSKSYKQYLVYPIYRSPVRGDFQHPHKWLGLTSWVSALRNHELNHNRSIPPSFQGREDIACPLKRGMSMVSIHSQLYCRRNHIVHRDSQNGIVVEYNHRNAHQRNKVSSFWSLMLIQTFVRKY
jgi:hypothetical protein